MEQSKEKEPLCNAWHFAKRAVKLNHVVYTSIPLYSVDVLIVYIKYFNVYFSLNLSKTQIFEILIKKKN